MTEAAVWVRMRSGDWKLSVPGRQWAVGFVWKTREGYDGYVPGAPAEEPWPKFLSLRELQHLAWVRWWAKEDPMLNGERSKEDQ